MYQHQISLVLLLAAITSIVGCRGSQYSHILQSKNIDMVGSHTAGAAVWNPLVDQSVSKLVCHCPPLQTVPNQDGAPNENLDRRPTVCFIGIENKSAEELGDFKDQLYERIDSQLNLNENTRNISQRLVVAALRETRLRPDALFLPANRQLFAAALNQQGSPVDYLIYARITSGTTERNRNTQRDYLLTLEMVNIHTGDFVKEAATIRKGYHPNRVAKLWNYGLFRQADG